MTNALVGFSGFVGSTLIKQQEFAALYRSTNIHQIAGKSYDTVVCAGAPAQKWLANKDPELDFQKIQNLVEHLKTVTCKLFILISTVDVFGDPRGVDEGSEVSEDGLHPYGLNRRHLEKFVAHHFENSLIVRLPGLIGPGLKKNVIFDLLNENNLSAIDSRAHFQFYPMVNLWYDILVALDAKLKLVHLTAAPISVAEVSMQGLGKPFDNSIGVKPASYDVTTRHAELFGAMGSYQYSKRDQIHAVRAYVQSEPVSDGLPL